MTGNNLRQLFLSFVQKHGHKIIPSAALVPENDPTTLFTSSGMQPLVPYLLGQPHPMGQKIANSQKCFRSQDIEEVGDNRHTTFFEMLGNWSLGSYFKEEQLTWFFEFLTQEVGLDPRRLSVTVFAGNENLGINKDEESIKIWQKLFFSAGIKAEEGKHIFVYDEAKNWWSRSGVPAQMPVGEPGGPDSEVFYDFDPDNKLKLHENSEFANQKCHVNCDCGRFMEIGNSVFMQYQKQADGSFQELPQKNVDFGGGLERILAAANNQLDVFQTDLFRPMIEKLEEISGQKYVGNESSFRVIADHTKAAVMLIADGVVPSNKAQGYVLRRLIRRSVRYGRMLNITRPFMAELVAIVATMYEESYPEVEKQKARSQKILTEEENKFLKTLDRGLKEIEKLSELNSEKAFSLYETYGFPLELSLEIAKERGQIIDLNKFEAALKLHQEKSRSAASGMFKGGLADQSEAVIKYHTTTHLLHAALRKILGPQVEQKGSNLTAERLRFDFSYHGALSSKQIAEIETLINDWIKQDLPVTKQVMKKSAALESGAIAFFVEKYPEEVTVYTIGADDNFVSKEFCGGPHVNHTGELKPIKIIKEQSVSAGVRRIYAQV